MPAKPHCRFGFIKDPSNCLIVDSSIGLVIVKAQIGSSSILMNINVRVEELN